MNNYIPYCCLGINSDIEKPAKILKNVRSALENAKRQKWHWGLEDYKFGNIYNWQSEAVSIVGVLYMVKVSRK